MDSRAFDELSKRLAEKTSRGRALKLFGGALVGTFVGSGAAHAHPPQKHCKYARYSCQRNIDCCSNNCCNRICCDDGMTCCGGECLRCPTGQTVDPNTCECVSGGPGPVCGNSICEAGETCTTCPQDCGPCPGVCGDGNCDPAAGEDCNTCPEDCGPCPGVCGDGNCDPAAGEDCFSCPDDCGPCGFCGDGVCDPALGEDCSSCPQDCGTCPGQCPAGSDSCVSIVNCGTEPNCFCFPTTEGVSACVNTSGVFCSPTPECVTSADCPNGVCILVAGCCPGLGQTLCAPPC